MILILDNFDSFTYNLLDYLSQLGVTCQVVRNNQPLAKIALETYRGILFSPGPENPSRAGNMQAVIAASSGRVPILGICLGHQGIGEFFGAKLVRASKPMHGKISDVVHHSGIMFDGIPEEIKVVRYHSLILSDIPDSLRVSATTAQGEVMAIDHQELPIHGLQFHPEAVLTQYGMEMLRNWVSFYDLAN